jgi:uncharacterized membrane protein
MIPAGAWGRLLRHAAPVLPLAGGALALRLLDRPGPAALLAAGAVALSIGRRLHVTARLALAGGLGALALACAAWPERMVLLARLLPVAGDLLLAAHFGATLRPGREPLISRYTRHDPGTRLAECAGYTRGLTWLWTLLFLALAPLHAVALLGLPPFVAPVPAPVVLAGSAVLMLALFLGEHVIRTLRFPQFGIATPARTLRAVLAATLAHHA